MRVLGAHGRQKASVSLDLEFLVTVSDLMWVLGVKQIISKSTKLS